MIWQRLLGLEFARRAMLRTAPAGPLQNYLSHPLPNTGQLCRDTDILALDFETTGLDPRRDHILSVGCVLVRDWGISLATAQHRYVQISGTVPEAAAVIHHITDDASAQGDTLDTVLAWLLTQLQGRVLLAHHSQVELSFLDHSCRRLYGTPFIARSIDTLRLAQRRLTRLNQPIRSGDLRLFNLRERYHLPQYKAHNALSDALSCAELFLALAAESGDLSGCRLREILD